MYLNIQVGSVIKWSGGGKDIVIRVNYPFVVVIEQGRYSLPINLNQYRPDWKLIIE